MNLRGNSTMTEGIDTSERLLWLDNKMCECGHSFVYHSITADRKCYHRDCHRHCMKFREERIKSMKHAQLKPGDFSVVEFTGKNSKEIAEWMSTKPGVTAKAGGSYVNVIIDDEVMPRLRKDAWVIWDEENFCFSVYEEDHFKAFFEISEF